MSYFINFPKILYSTSLGVKNPVLATNIIAKANFLAETANNTSVYYKYSVKDGERAEDIANKMYGSPLKHWIILLSNNIMDPQYDWPLSSSALEQYIDKKYSSITLQLDPSETYSNNYVVGEQAFQGPNYASSSAHGTVAAYNNSTKQLTIKFTNEVFANSGNVVGATSGETHKILSLTYNNDGYEWASNTTSHYEVTEVTSNSFDNTKSTNKYTVSTGDYNFATNTVYNRNTNTSYSNSYALSDGTTLTINTSVAPVTYYDYELQLNEDKRSIIIIKPEFVNTIEAQLRTLMRS